MVRTYAFVPLVILSLLVIVACGPEKEPTPEPVAQATAAQSEPTAAPTEAPTAEPAPKPTAEPTTAPSADAAADAVAQEADDTGGAAQELDWGAKKDGCIIPGLVISGQLAGGIPCEPVTVGEAAEEQAEGVGEEADMTEEVAQDEPSSDDASQSQDVQAVEMTALAVNDLSQQLGVPAGEIEVCDVCTVDWPDSSLGCPEPGMMYAQVVQPGHLIRLTVDGKTYFYHSGGMQPPFICDQTLQILPPDIKDD